LASAQVPGNSNLTPLQASSLTYTDSNTNTMTGFVLADQIQNAVWLGRCYCATTTAFATATNPSLLMGASLFNPNASGKTFYVFSAEWSTVSASVSAKYTLTTSNPGYATTISPANMYAAFATASVASVTSAANAATASITATGTTQDVAFMPANTTYDFFATHPGVIIPANNGISVFGTVASAAQNWAVTFRWVEF
jgi:hypothetical protein